MQEQNGSKGPLHAPDFNQDLREAQRTGDFDYVLETAKKTHQMFLDFRNAIKQAQYRGADAHAIAMGLNFLENMINNSSGQLGALKQAEKQTREALKASLKNNGTPLAVVEPVGPEEPETPPPPPVPDDVPDAPQEPTGA